MKKDAAKGSEVGEEGEGEMGRDIESLTCVGGWIVRGWHA